jgi:hypothetical protein
MFETEPVVITKEELDRSYKKLEQRSLESERAIEKAVKFSLDLSRSQRMAYVSVYEKMASILRAWSAQLSKEKNP